MTLRRAFSLAAAFAVAAAACTAAQAAVTVSPAAKGYDIDITDPVSTADLIAAITGATGATVTGEPADASIPTNHLRSVSLERALRTLLPSAPFAIRFDSEGKPTAIIFLPTTAGGSAPVDGSAPLPAALPDAAMDSGPDMGADTGADTGSDTSSDTGADDGTDSDGSDDGTDSQTDGN